MVRIPGFHCCGPGSIPGRGTEILQAVWCGQKIKIKRDQVVDSRVAGRDQCGGSLLNPCVVREGLLEVTPEDLGAREQQVLRSEGARLRNRRKVCAARGREQMGDGCGVRWTRQAGSDHTAWRARSGLCIDSGGCSGRPLEGSCRGVECLIYLFIFKITLLAEWKTDISW